MTKDLSDMDTVFTILGWFWWSNLLVKFVLNFGGIPICRLRKSWSSHFHWLVIAFAPPELENSSCRVHSPKVHRWNQPKVVFCGKVGLSVGKAIRYERPFLIAAVREGALRPISSDLLPFWTGLCWSPQLFSYVTRNIVTLCVFLISFCPCLLHVPSR